MTITTQSFVDKDNLFESYFPQLKSSTLVQNNSLFMSSIFPLAIKKHPNGTFRILLDGNALNTFIERRPFIYDNQLLANDNNNSIVRRQG
jgi:hypothetical protein